MVWTGKRSLVRRVPFTAGTALDLSVGVGFRTSQALVRVNCTIDQSFCTVLSVQMGKWSASKVMADLMTTKREWKWEN